MILILTEKFDHPAQNVIKELEKETANFKVIYGIDLLEKPLLIDVKNKIIKLGDEKFEDINITWSRRWLNINFEFSTNPDEQIYLKKEFETLSSYFMINLPTKKWLNIPKYINPYPSKAHQLKKAFEYGLKIPDTQIINNNIFLNNFYFAQKEKIITKNICDSYVFKVEKDLYSTYTTIVRKEDIDNQNELFFPSLFQENIEKNIEIRIFYFLKKFYSYAIFSTNNYNTNTDYRVYDFKNPDRIMKYELPNDIKLKLIGFMECLNLDTGSIDLIKDSNGEFYFLEVNPQGQFGGMADYGLNIESDIAKYLIKNDYED
ncbi:hypothetical protein SAMN05880574_10932 [Chryseobacterium sp. RU37D]|uniref:hypothetical protein n=1 Tax=Chryseobacterium sp. RU37D TaxID=1907397 RepID=UPI0009564622|nr:hypothetical protein [Chryseobacterium sp. RU37D]SIQ27102.1 hypothetical protein SAMN05880574_10932 [Chryseobacterium sp. RU37D]